MSTKGHAGGKDIMEKDSGQEAINATGGTWKWQYRTKLGPGRKENGHPVAFTGSDKAHAQDGLLQPLLIILSAVEMLCDSALY